MLQLVDRTVQVCRQRINGEVLKDRLAVRALLQVSMLFIRQLAFTIDERPDIAG